MWVAFANAKATHIFFSKNISLYAIFNDQSFKDTLTNDIINFEQLGPGLWRKDNVLHSTVQMKHWNDNSQLMFAVHFLHYRRARSLWVVSVQTRTQSL